MRTVVKLVVLATVWWSPIVAFAELTAHFRAESIDGGCVNGDSEPIGAGDPDRYFRMAIFDEYSLNQTCASGCSDDGVSSTEDVRSFDYCTQSSGCGAWNFTNQTISKVVPPAGGVYFYFGLWDADGDADDSLGDHWFFENGPRTARTDWNNNSSPYDADTPILDTCSGRDVEGSGSSDNFELTYSVWFTDTTGPDVSLSTPTNMDDGLYDVTDNDERLDWQWNLASDPDTGIDEYRFSLYDETAATYVYLAAAAPSDGAISFCASGCDRSYVPQHGHTYRLKIRATNGSYPEIENPDIEWSAWSASIDVDLVDPTAQIAAPAPSSWHNGDFSIDFQDDDEGAGLDPGECGWRVESDGVVTSDWGSRACNASRVVTVGPGLDCQHEGSDACIIEADNEDLARRASSIAARAFGIDWTADDIAAVTARTGAGGRVLDPSSWTTDRDPHFSWTAASSVAPIAGYSWALNASPDCGSVEVSAADPLEVALPSRYLSDGVFQFQVRAIDAAGNCGSVATATVQVDSQAEPVVNLHATSSTGQTIPAATWQPENTPTLRWDAASSASPVTGYSYGAGTLTDCVVETNSTTASISTLADGVHTFWVRAVDAAGNCGPPANLTLYVDATADSIFNLRALTQQAGAPIPPGAPQPDRTPWMQWDVPSSASPIAGYSYGTTVMHDCTIDTQMPGAGLGMLPDGLTTFWVRAIDSAGNCGTAATFDIVVAECGDGIVGPGETCDDGNDDETDGCVSCVEATCGDGFVHAGEEQCDDGDDNSDVEPDACRTDCSAPRCGDGVLDAGESCDAGDANSDDPGAPCRTNCALASCGDGVLDVGEQCDDGEQNDDAAPDACRTTCVPAFCGDGVLDQGEACDDGSRNSDYHPNLCRDSCELPTCGDGIIDDGEVCDDGSMNSDVDPDACRTSCMPAACGDGVVDADEECEPGDRADDLVCMDDCRFGAPTTMDDPRPGEDTGAAALPDVGGDEPDMGVASLPDIDSGEGAEPPEMILANEATCCAQVNRKAHTFWQLVLIALFFAGVCRRQRRT